MELSIIIYLKRFKLLNDEKNDIACLINKTHNSYYHLHIFPDKELEEIKFEPITIIYGGNGSGKTTLLNIIAASLKASKKTFYDSGNLFDSYVEECRFSMDFDDSECLEVKFIIFTHSLFLLSLKDALIYDLDEEPVTTKKWTELENVKVYYNFFKEYEDEFN